MKKLRSSMKKWALSLYVLNLWDMAATLYFVVGMGMIEANPLMAWLLELHPIAFVLVKVVLMAGFLWYLAIKAPVTKKLLWALRIMTFVYFLLACFHVFGFWVVHG